METIVIEKDVPVLVELMSVSAGTRGFQLHRKILNKNLLRL
jgi:hypothetical protein